jgi:vancomycin resistance protein YoaR
LSVQGSTTAGRVRRRQASVRRGRIRLAAAAAVVLGTVLAVGIVFAGSPEKIAAGVHVAGVDVGGMTPKAAQALLVRRAASRADVPVTFVAGSQSWQIRPSDLGVAENWKRAVDDAAEKGGGNALVRGYRRLGLRLFGADVEPTVRAYNAAVEYKIELIAKEVDDPHVDARLVRHGLTFDVTPSHAGRVLDRAAAQTIVVAALAGSARGPVDLSVKVDPPRVTAARLAAVERRAERIVSAPVTLKIGIANFVVERQTLAAMLQLPEAGSTKLTLGGRATTAYFARLDREVSSPAKDADFVVGDGGAISISPAQQGVALDVPRTAARLLAAAERAQTRSARIVVATAQPQRTTAEARAMGITGTVSSYETIYGGIANRIHNVQLVAKLIDGKLIAPGATFSFNDATGERTADKGFLDAPVIINGELSTGLGGGVCQVSTTVFNAAYEAGLPITSRTNHALYISHYPLGRDATVDFPNIDLKFVNDTGHWLLLRTFVGSSSLVVNLYGTPQHRRVETESAPLRVVGPTPIEKIHDDSVAPGTRVIQEYGVPAQATSVHRTVYSANGKLLSDATWYSSYDAEPRIVLIGPKKEKEKPKPSNKQPATTEPAVTPRGPAPPQ